ncbi:cadherin domain-containing protein [Roseiconus nitratireducens]|nr:cadherin domain-containing protein [Roseiconus nitratireducens]
MKSTLSRRLRMESLESRRLLAATLDTLFDGDGIYQVPAAEQGDRPKAFLDGGQVILGDAGDFDNYLLVDPDSNPVSATPFAASAPVLDDLDLIPGGGYIGAARPSGNTDLNTIYKLNTDGSIDTSFGGSGSGFESFLLEDASTSGSTNPVRYRFDNPFVTVAPDGSIYVSGNISDVTPATPTTGIQTIQFDPVELSPYLSQRRRLGAIVKLQSDGSIDRGFNDESATNRQGLVQTPMNLRDLAISPTGDVVVSGLTDPGYSGGNGPNAIGLSYLEWSTRVEQYSSDGVVDVSFGTGGATVISELKNLDSIGDINSVDSLAFDSEGGLLLTGYSPSTQNNPNDQGMSTYNTGARVARLLSDGQIDVDFGSQGTQQLTSIDLFSVQGGYASLANLSTDLPIAVDSGTVFVGAYEQQMPDSVNAQQRIAVQEGLLYSFPSDDVTQASAGLITTPLGGSTAFYPAAIEVDGDEYLVAGATFVDSLQDSAFRYGMTDVIVGLVQMYNPNQPVATGFATNLAENSPAGTSVGTVQATDIDPADNVPGALTFSITAGNLNSVFDIDSQSGEITVGQNASLDYEIQDRYELVVTVTDSAGLTDRASVMIDIDDVPEPNAKPVYVNGSVLVVNAEQNGSTVAVRVSQGQIQVSSRDFPNESFPLTGIELIRINGGDGDDRLMVANSVTIPVVISGGAGDDFISGGSASDALLGGPGNDFIFGRDGNDLLSGGDGVDALYGGAGEDILFGGADADKLLGQSGSDFIVTEQTDYDDDLASLLLILQEWNTAESFADRVNNLILGTGEFLSDTEIHLLINDTITNDDALDQVIGNNVDDFLLPEA